MARNSNTEFTTPLSVTVSVKIEIDGPDNDNLGTAIIEALSKLA